MTLAVRSVSTATNDGAYDNPVSVNAPTGLTSGDLLVAVIFQSYESTGNSVTLPSGFTVTGSTGAVTGATGIWAETAWKVAGNSEPTSYTFTGAGNPSTCIILWAIKGANTSTPIGATPVYTAGSSASTSHTVPSVTPNDVTDMLLTAVSCVANSKQYTGYPAGMNAGADFLDPTNYEEATYTSQLLSSSSATGVRTFTHTTSAQWVGVALTIRSLPVGAPTLISSGVTARHAVEFAWGAIPGSDPSTWAWTDVTGDVNYEQKVKITVGSGPETVTPQPAQVTLTLDNRSGNYSRGPQSANYPNVRKGVPIRFRILYNGTSYVRFLGEVSSFVPGWDSTGRWATAAVTASGVKRRLQQPQPAGYSLLRQLLTAVSGGTLTYWPCEETTGSKFSPTSANVGAIQIAGGTPSLASYSGFAGTGPIPTLSQGESWFGKPPIATGASSAVAFSIAFLLNTPAAGLPDQTTIVQVNTAGSTAQLQLRYAGTPTAGGLRLLGLDFKGNTVLDSGTILPADIGKSVVGQPCVVVIALSNNVLAFNVASFTENNSFNSAYVYSVTTGTLIGIDSFTFAPAGTLTGVSVGHISCQQAGFEDGTHYYPYAFGFEFDLTTSSVHVPPWIRMEAAANLVGERIPVQVHGAGNDQNTSTPAIGVARMGLYDPGLSYLQLCEEAALADGGMLADGLDSGNGLALTFYTRDSIENQTAVLTLNAGISETEHPVAPVDDDLGIVNTATVTRKGGSTVTATDTTDNLSTTAIGLYGSSQTVNVETDAQARDWAGWAVHLGTVDDYRWPTINMWLHHKPELLGAWLATPLCSRVDVTNLSSVRSQLASGTLSLLLLGWTETIDQVEWSIVGNTVSYDPWHVAVWAQDIGDTGENIIRWETDGSYNYVQVNAGDSAIHVQTSMGPVWTQAADDFPLFVNVGGWKVKVTAIGAPTLGAQTFTVDPTTVPAKIPVNSPVTVWKAPVFAR